MQMRGVYYKVVHSCSVYLTFKKSNRYHSTILSYTILKGVQLRLH
jgi:hypothetical protein